MAEDPSVYSLVLSVKEFSTKQQISHNQTESTTEAPCYVNVNDCDSADLYRKAASAEGCILMVSGDYLIDKPLALSVRVEAAEKPVISSDDDESELYIPVRPESRKPLNRDIALFTPLPISDGESVVSAAVFTIDSGLEESYLILSFDAALYGVGIKTEDGAVDKSGCLLIGISKA